MNRQFPSEIRDALRVQVAAIVAQQAAVTEHEIRLGEARDQFFSEQRSLVADVESLLVLLLAQEEHLERRHAEAGTREAFIARLESASSRLIRELGLVQEILSRESAPSMPRLRAA
jgi:hypothetical protein